MSTEKAPVCVDGLSDRAVLENPVGKVRTAFERRRCCFDGPAVISGRTTLNPERLIVGTPGSWSSNNVKGSGEATE